VGHETTNGVSSSALSLVVLYTESNKGLASRWGRRRQLFDPHQRYVCLPTWTGKFAVERQMGRLQHEANEYGVDTRDVTAMFSEIKVSEIQPRSVGACLITLKVYDTVPYFY
jgi:hypothetical protein